MLRERDIMPMVCNSMTARYMPDYYLDAGQDTEELMPTVWCHAREARSASLRMAGKVLCVLTCDRAVDPSTTQDLSIEANIALEVIIYIDSLTFLHRCGLDCSDLESIQINDKILTNDSIDKIIGLALSHHLTNNKNKIDQTTSKLVLSCESIKHAADSLQSIQAEAKTLNSPQSIPGEAKSLKKSLKDVVTENEFEKRILSDVIGPQEIGVTFANVGALENVKETLKELVMLPLQRPELFCEGNLTKVSDTVLKSPRTNHQASIDCGGACSSSNSLQSFNNQNTKIALTAPGPRYFICGTSGHCTTRTDRSFSKLTRANHGYTSSSAKSPSDGADQNKNKGSGNFVENKGGSAVENNKCSGDYITVENNFRLVASLQGHQTAITGIGLPTGGSGDNVILDSPWV